MKYEIKHTVNKKKQGEEVSFLLLDRQNKSVNKTKRKREKIEKQIQLFY